MQPPARLMSALFTGALIISCTLPSQAGEQRLLDNPGVWKQLDLSNKAPTRFQLTRGKVDVIADRSVAFLYRELQPVMTKRPMVAWRWKVDRNIPATDQTRARRDDRPVAVHLWFDDRKSGSLFGQFASLLGKPRVGHLISYVWGGKRAPGTVLRNPYYPKKGAIIILRNGRSSTSGWKLESRDIAADFKRSFGKRADLSSLRYVSVSGDTDDTRTISRSSVKDFRIIE